jgi:hypothetical protein
VITPKKPKPSMPIGEAFSGQCGGPFSFEALLILLQSPTKCLPLAYLKNTDPLKVAGHFGYITNRLL